MSWKQLIMKTINELFMTVISINQQIGSWSTEPIASHELHAENLISFVKTLIQLNAI